MMDLGDISNVVPNSVISAGRAIKYNTRDIVGDTYARATAVVGSYSQLDLKGTFSTGLTDDFYVGASFAYLSRGGNNLTDKEYLQSGYDFGPTINYISQLGFYGAPRNFNLSATFTY